MGLFVTDGIEALDVTLFGGPPVGAVRVDLTHGLSVLYGENGSGKSTILGGIESALTGVRRPHGGDAYLRCRPVRAWSGYDPTLITRVAASTHVAALQVSAVDSDSAAEGLWESAIRALSPDYEDQDLRDWNHTEERHHRIVDQLALDMRSLCPEVPEPEPLDLLLVADGSAAEPAWLLYISRRVEATPALRSAAAATTGLIFLGELAFSRLDLQRFGASPFDTWTPRLRHVGRISAHEATRIVTGGHAFDIDAATINRITMDLSETGDELLNRADGDTFELSTTAVDSVARLQQDATAFFRRFVDIDADLIFEPGHPSTWLTSGLGIWMVREPSGALVKIDNQGSAHRRWANFAIEVSMISDRHEWPLILILDEPENALHPAAQSYLAKGLSFDHEDDIVGALTSYGVMIATHSPALLQAHPARLLRVHREGTTVRVDPIAGLQHVDEFALRLGLSRSDVLAMTRTFVLVEGEHDEIVLTGLFGDEFARRSARILTMRGAKKATAMLEIETLARYSAARLVFVIDNLGRQATSDWDAAVAAFVSGDVDAAKRAVHRLERLPGGEGKWLCEAGLAAIAAGALDRTRLVGLKKKDIVEYLPVGLLVPGAGTWRQLRAEHKASGDRTEFKAWLRSIGRSKISPATIRNAIGTMDGDNDLPTVLDALA